MTIAARREKRPPSSLPKGQLRLDGQNLDGEAWLANRLTEWHGVPDVFGGVSTPESRKAGIRAGIVEHGLEWVICGRDSSSRKCLTWGETFHRLYGEKL